MHTSPDRDARLLPWIDAVGPLLDGGIVDTSSCFDDAARRACASQAPAADEQQGYLRLLNCIMHSDDERCEACGNDKS